jgi:hypothetical protein
MSYNKIEQIYRKLFSLKKHENGKASVFNNADIIVRDKSTLILLKLDNLVDILQEPKESHGQRATQQVCLKWSNLLGVREASTFRTC